MIIDGRRIPATETLYTEVCIIGGGPAGITLALELRNLDCRVLLLESGTFQPSIASQTLSEGVNIGLPYYSLAACRPRCLGGTTSTWGGWCRPLDRVDFEERSSIPYSGWPISKQDLAREYDRAQQVCRLGANDYDAKSWTLDGKAGLFSSADNAFFDSIFQVAAVRFGEAYRKELAGSSNIQILLNTSALELEPDSQGKTVERVRVGAVGGNSYSVAARVFVLAAGGIENARILLNSRTVRSKGMGNDYDVVGRYFADHLHVPLGILGIRAGEMQFYEPRKVKGTSVRGVIGITEQFRRNADLLGFGATFHNADDPHDVLRPADRRGYHSLMSIINPLRRGEVPGDILCNLSRVTSDFGGTLSMLHRRIHKPARVRLVVGCRAEQAPNPSSRVQLDMSKDRFGMQKARLDWRISRLDLDSLCTSQRLLKGVLERRSMSIVSWDSISDTYKPTGGAHHIGTTRMHPDPKFGVVDSNCRVHSVSNLYISGSSVFPTSGWTTPTLTIVALTMRLADHLKVVLRHDLLRA